MRAVLRKNTGSSGPLFTIPKMVRIFFKYNRRLLGELCRLAERRGLADFRRFLPCPRLPGPFPLGFSSIRHPTMLRSIIPNDGRRQDWCMNAYSANAAENEILILQSGR